MNKLKTLKWLVGVLLLLNIGLMAFMYMSRGHDGPPPPRPDRQEKLNDRVPDVFEFNEEQTAAFLESKHKHQKLSSESTRKLHDLSIAYYKSTDDEEKVNMLSQINEVNQTIYTINSNHFEEVRSICDSAQLENMDHFIDELLVRDRKNKKRKRKKRRD